MASETLPARSGLDYRWLPLGVTTIGAFMSILDTNIVNIALPSILKDFNTSLGMGQLVVASYLTALAVVIPLSGFLGERVGMKRLYLITLACFTLGSALCGLAWNVESLIFFRVLQGLGGGMLQPLGMAIVFTMITPMERPRFMAVLGLPALLAPIVGPSVGGYIVQYASWRWVFLINLPIGALDIGLAYFLLKETPLMTGTRMDWRGFTLAAIAFPSILLGLSRGSEQHWSSPLVIGLLLTGGIAFVAFVVVELRHHDPMLRLRLFANQTFRISLIIQWIGFFSLFGLNFLMPLFLQRVHGLSPAAAGRVLLPMGLVAFTTMNVAGRIYYKVGPRPILFTGLMTLAITTFLWSRTDANSSILFMMVLVSLRGLGLGCFGQIVGVVAFNAVPEGQMPRATALVNVAMRLTGAMSTATLTTVLVIALTHAGAPADTSIADGTAPLGAMVHAFRDTFYLMTALSLIGAGLVYFLHDHVWEAHHRGETVESRTVPPASAEPVTEA